MSSTSNNGTRTISISSGKGGVGKTTVTVNMAYNLGKLGKRVLILDGDMSLANVDLFLKKTPEFTLQDFFEGTVELKDVLVKYTKNIHVLPGASGALELSRLDVYQKKMLVDAMSEFEGLYDYLLIDTASGVSDEVLYLSSAAQEVMVVVLPDPASITDAYALMKLLNQRYKTKSFSIVTNQVMNEKESLALFQRINSVAAKFLNVNLNYVGFIPFDLTLRQANHRQEMIGDFAPQSNSHQSLKRIAEKIEGLPGNPEMQGGLQFFWNQILDIA
ncbi:MAG: MinD/ParA family protein [Bdellovibrionaceae bacterium]|nr:MinD/ParA family protein [Pseudobdellovibrionaceae bacterium]